MGSTINMKNKQTHDNLFMRIKVIFTKVFLLFKRFFNNLSFWIIKFVFTVSTKIFWRLSLSNRNINTTTFWTNFNKIPSHLDKFIIRLFNKSICISAQTLISDFCIVAIYIKKSVWEVICN